MEAIVNADYLRRHVVDPIILHLLTTDIDWRNQTTGGSLPPCDLDKFLREKCEDTTKWLPDNLEGLRNYLIDAESKEGYYDYQGDDDINQPNWKFLESLGLKNIMQAMHEDDSDYIMRKYVHPYFKLVVE